MSDRYLRHDLIPGWNQRQLAAATVVVAGVGALGTEAARILALSGVGRLILCDPDRVEESNLSRAPLFRGSDVGRWKVDAARDALADLAPDASLDSRPLPLVHGVGLAELRDASLVLGCLDSRTARLQLAGRCALVRALSIDGGTHPWGGEIRLFLDPGGPCYGCTLSADERAVTDVPWSCLETAPQDHPSGAAAPSSAVVAAWMASCAVRFLMGLPCPAGTLHVDLPRGTTRVIDQTRDPECPFHRPLDSTTRLDVSHCDTVGRLRAALPEGGVPLLWEPVQCAAACRQCGFREPVWGRPIRPTCPMCGQRWLPHTTLELAQAPAVQTLDALGIAPREILAVRTAAGLQWVELADATPTPRPASASIPSSDLVVQPSNPENSPMKLTMQDLLTQGVLEELARVFGMGGSAHVLLDRGEFPSIYWPTNAENPLAFWRSICQMILNGITNKDLESLLAIAGEMYPGNRVFAPFRGTGQPAGQAGAAPPASPVPAAGPAPTRVFDTFLAYNSREASTVLRIAQSLQKRGLDPWLDQWYCPGGTLVIREIDGVLKNTPSITVIIGPDGQGPWQKLEIEAALQMFVRQDRRLIPVLLPGVSDKPDIPWFLYSFSWIRLAPGRDFEALLDALAWAIREAKGGGVTP